MDDQRDYAEESYWRNYSEEPPTEERGQTMTTETTPTVGRISHRPGIAGQVEVSAEVTYPGEPMTVTHFVGSVYGGPVVMVLPSGVQTFVTDPGRFGTFETNPAQWVLRFFGVSENVV